MPLDNRFHLTSKAHIEVIRNPKLRVVDLSWELNNNDETIGFDQELIPIANDLCFVLHRANRVTSRGADAALRATGLTAKQTLLLAAIAEVGALRASDICRGLGIDASTVAANLKPLMREGWVITSLDINARRARKIILTEAGIERLKVAARQLQEYEQGLAADRGGRFELYSLYQQLNQVTEACR